MTAIIGIGMTDIRRSSLNTAMTKLVDSMFKIKGVDMYKSHKTSNCFAKVKYSKDAKSNLFSYNVLMEDAMKIQLKGIKSQMN